MSIGAVKSHNSLISVNEFRSVLAFACPIWVTGVRDVRVMLFIVCGIRKYRRRED
jgi:hypothetical protein